MLSTTKSITVNGTSTITVGDTKKSVVVMNGNINAEGKCNVSTYIQDEDLYKANKDEARKDIMDFYDYCESLSNN